jgi:ubiquinone/menaquinone biosynthesis C-methylase UbiE
MQETADGTAGAARYWDTVASRYLELFHNEFQSKPYDRGVLKTFAAALPPGAKVCDIGCGPCGHVARMLADDGLDVVGIDLSPKCVALARAEQPALRFETMDMSRMSFDDGSLDGLVAYYALHYQPKHSLPPVFRECARVLRPGGKMLLVAKEGCGEGWIDDPMEIAGQVFWSTFSPGELSDLCAGAGFKPVTSTVRDPLPQEIPVRRIYVNAERGR